MSLYKAANLRGIRTTQVAEGDAKEKDIADARAAKEKVTAKEQQEQLQEFQVLAGHNVTTATKFEIAAPYVQIRCDWLSVKVRLPRQRYFSPQTTL